MPILLGRLQLQVLYEEEGAACYRVSISALAGDEDLTFCAFSNLNLIARKAAKEAAEKDASPEDVSLNVPRCEQL